MCRSLAVFECHCVGRCSADLQHWCDYVPTVIVQLSILASVKATADDDHDSEKQLIQTAQSLATAINRMLNAAEGATVKVIITTEFLWYYLLTFNRDAFIEEQTLTCDCEIRCNPMYVTKSKSE